MAVTTRINQAVITLGVDSDIIELGDSKAMSVQISWGTLTAGSPTVDIQVSNDKLNFISLLSAPSAMDIAGSSFMLIEPSTPYNFIKVVTAAGGSTGEYSVHIVKK